MTSDEQLERLNVAAAVLIMQRNLRDSGKTEIFWGIFCLAVGGVFFAGGHLLSAGINLAFALLLTVSGIRQLRAPDAAAIKVAAITLGILGAWNLGTFALALMAKNPLAGHPIIGAIQLLGAYNTWASYSTYAALFSRVDPATLETVRQKVDEMSPSPETIEFEVSASKTQQWLLRWMDDLAFFVAREGGAFGTKGELKEVFFARRSALQVETTGETWMGKKIKAKLQLGHATIEKAQFKPEMLERIQGRAIGTFG